MLHCDILIVDNDVDDVEILADAFLQCGLSNVHHVYTAMQAFSYLESISNKDDLPKLIIIDLYLPGMTGEEFLYDLKRMEPYKHIVIIVLSSVKSVADIKKAHEAGAAEYLEKPYSYQEYKAVASDIATRVLPFYKN